MRAWISSAALGLSTWGPLLLLVIIGFAVAYRYVGAPPPRIIRLATGAPDGAYHQFGQRYAAILAQDGITVDLVPTAGSAENLARLNAGEVMLALVQGGSISDADRDRLQSLGSLFAEPLWVFTPSGAAIHRLSDLKGARVGIGAPGSGTQQLAHRVLSANGVTDANTTFVQASPAEMVQLLPMGSLDAAMLVASPSAPVVRQFLENSGVGLLDLERAAAYAHRFGFLTPATLGEGVIDLERNLPPRDTRLVATVASLAARRDLNDSLIPALLNAAMQVHGAGGILESNRRLPSAEPVGLPVNEVAARYLREGPSFLYRWLPYRTAVLIDRVKVLALPVMALLLPLFKIGPPLYQWRVRSRIYRWYADVRAIDMRLLAGTDADRESMLRQLRELEHDVAATAVPLAYTGELYHLRLHIRLLVDELTRHARRDPPRWAVQSPSRTPAGAIERSEQRPEQRRG
ncbi:MAG: TAXI family TRAP transporter solute-binding subunit [Vicinamibacterales bacterium]